MNLRGGPRLNPSSLVPVLWFLISPAPALMAQSGRSSVIGIVVEDETLAPIAGATVTVQGAEPIVTDADGGFVIPIAPPGSLTVRIEASGYPTTVEEVVVVAGEITFAQFRLASVQAILDEVFVVSRARAGNEGREIRAEAFEASYTAADLLARRVPGILVRGPSTGSRESGRILLRGVGSLTLNPEPAIYLNGVRITGGSGARRNEAFDILRQIPASDVARIRVLHPSSASTMYGDAANGVIVIETRSGGEPVP